MASEKKNDIEAGNPVELTPTDTDETPKPLSKTITNLSERLSKQVRSMLPSRKPHQASTSKLPGDIGLTTMACILRSLVIADDMVGVSAMIRLVEDRNFDKTEAFTIQDVAGNGLLQIAALKNRKSMTETLLKEGFDINYVDDNHGTALQAAIYMDSREVSDVLLDKEWNINVETTGGYYGCALQVATYKGSDHYINLLLGRGIKDDVCIPKSKYGTSLQAAARTGVPSIVEKILKLNFDVNAEFGVYGGALQAAAKGKYTSDTEYLRSLSRGHVLREDTGVRRQTSKDQVDYLEVAKILVEKKAKVNASGGRLGSPINAAASSGDPSMLEFLLDKDKNSSYDDGQKKAMYNRALLSAITQEFNKKRRGLVEELIRGGADVDCEVGSSTPLAAAAAMNDLEVVKYLLEKVKDKDLKKFMDAKSGIYGSALHAALSAPKPADQTALHLIKKGANLSKEEHKYGNILHLAAFANLDEVVQLLLEQNEPKVEIDALDNNDQTALHIAAYRGYHKVVDVLLKSGATANMKDVWGNTPLHIVEDELENDGHPVPSLHDLRKTKEKLLRALVLENKQQTGSPVGGPYLSKKPQASESLPKKARPVFESPQWNPGLKFRASIVDFLDIEDREHIKVRDLLIDDLLYKDGAIDAKMDEKGLIDSKKGKLKLRWIHLPANNMTWAQMLIKVLWRQKYEGTDCSNIWGPDPYFASPDLAPYARIVTPQCGRLISEPHCGQESSGDQISRVKSGSELADTLFLAMPYIHWESRLGQLQARKVLENFRKSTKKRLFRSRNSWRRAEDLGNLNRGSENTASLGATPKNTNQETTKAKLSRYLKSFLGADEDSIAPHGEQASSPSQEPNGTQDQSRNTKPDDNDDKLLEKYLFKRWPLHLRRTLAQSYYSYLADTRTRDNNQVPMKAQSKKLQQEKQFIAECVKMHTGKDTKQKKLKGEQRLPESSKDAAPTHKSPQEAAKKLMSEREQNFLQVSKDDSDLGDNRPVVMVDQLWLWVVSKDLIITCFPRRRSEKEADDLDPGDKTDVLKTILAYLSSTERSPIKDSYSLCEVIVSETVEILHRSGVIPELDLLKVFATEADSAFNNAMIGFTEFVERHKNFREWLEQKTHNPAHYIKLFERIFNVQGETELLQDIRDMQDELTMLAAVFRDQIKVLEQAGEHIYKSRNGAQENTVEGICKNCPAPFKTHSSAFGIQQRSEKHANHIKRMQEQIRQAYQNLKDLLDLKQQQANLLEARVNRNQAIAAKEQSKAIMLFTIVTIIFLPLTFITTIFTLPILEFPRFDPTTLKPSSSGLLKGTYVFGISTGFTIALAIPLIMAAFKVRRLQHVWDDMKEFRKTIFPLHMMEKEIPTAKDDESDPIPLFGPFYWGGPSPRGDAILPDI